MEKWRHRNMETWAFRQIQRPMYSRYEITFARDLGV
jgi:hypothetical protein